MAVFSGRQRRVVAKIPSVVSWRMTCPSSPVCTGLDGQVMPMCAVNSRAARAFNITQLLPGSGRWHMKCTKDLGPGSHYQMTNNLLAYASITLATLLLAGCSSGDSQKLVSQVAARVGGHEITVHQINAALARLGNVGPDQLKQASSAVLERLIDQELLIAQAEEQKIDRDPAVMQALDAARREIVARAYVERVVGQVGRANLAEISQFYRDNPELFARRRVYAIQELNVAAVAERHAEIRAVLDKAANMDEFVDWLRRENISFTPGGGVKPAEDLPLAALKQLFKMRDGQTGVLSTSNGLHVVHLAGSREQPLDEAAAVPLIERYLASRKKGQIAQDELKQLRERASIEYVGEFSAPATAASASPAPARGAASQAGPAVPATSTAAPTLSPSAMEKGAGGLK
ncbi:EpsD family peptidyl-prolyl cis-trans isomerase [Aromatoleum diolicum]|uniref:Peptidyl-prolyl cis-trans isomerase, EpsD family n=1 Tax=Aromatoleum diolicum TaxID=75796 RepID=A0ABX1QGK7_9RHOO|nr:EpsD family peptidyl-prolyl cis-trans isomerase [Aromatoleum diolicum]NMG76655.1 peptidyl-prolyl cis-trans isomerase, EpsD family [Aromatoleum diolicum]